MKVEKLVILYFSGSLEIKLVVLFETFRIVGGRVCQNSVNTPEYITRLSFIALESSHDTCLGSVCVFRRKSLEKLLSPDWIAQLTRVSSLYTKVVGSVPTQGTYRDQPANS